MVTKRLVLLAGLSAAGGSGVLAQAQAPTLPVQVDSRQAVDACLTPAEQRLSMAQLDAATRRRMLSCILATTAAQIRTQLPLRIDELTELMEIASSGPALTYTYRISRRTTELPANAPQILESSTRTNVCAQANMVQTIAIGGSYAYRWLDRDGRQIHQMEVNRCG